MPALLNFVTPKNYLLGWIWKAWNQQFLVFSLFFLLISHKSNCRKWESYDCQLRRIKLMIFTIVQFPSASMYIEDSTAPTFRIWMSPSSKLWAWDVTGSEAYSTFQFSLVLLYEHLKHILRCQSIFVRIYECVVQNSEPWSKTKKKILVIWSHQYVEVILPHIKTYSILTLQLHLGVFLEKCRNGWWGSFYLNMYF